MYSISRKMSFGKVDEFGRFISEFDPEPDQDRKKGAYSKHSLKKNIVLFEGHEIVNDKRDTYNQCLIYF